MAKTKIERNPGIPLDPGRVNDTTCKAYRMFAIAKQPLRQDSVFEADKNAVSELETALAFNFIFF